MKSILSLFVLCFLICLILPLSAFPNDPVACYDMIYPEYLYPLPEECELRGVDHPEWLFCDGFESGNFSLWDVIADNNYVAVMDDYDGQIFQGHVANFNYSINNDIDETFVQSRYIVKNFDEGLDHFFTRACLFLDGAINTGIERELYRFVAINDEEKSNNDWEISLSSFDLNLALKFSVPEDDALEPDDNQTRYNLARLELHNWNCLEIEIKANTPGQRDGYVGLWNNEQLLYELKDVNLRGNLESKINSFELGRTAGRQNFLGVEESRYWDNVIFSSEDIKSYIFELHGNFYGGCLDPEEESGCGMVASSDSKKVGSLFLFISLLALFVIGRSKLSSSKRKFSMKNKVKSKTVFFYIVLILISTLYFSNVRANMAAPPPDWSLCAGKQIGDECLSNGSGFGICEEAFRNLDDCPAGINLCIECSYNPYKYCETKLPGERCASDERGVCIVVNDVTSVVDDPLGCALPQWEKCEGKTEGDSCGENQTCFLHPRSNACPPGVEPCLYCEEVEDVEENIMGGCSISKGASFSGLIGLFFLMAIVFVIRKRESFSK